jgi:hypothetical protein
MYPILMDYSSTFYAIKASKEFLMIFIYFSVLLFIRSRKDIEIAWNVIILLGLYYSFIELISQILGPSLLSHMSYTYRPESVFWKIYPPFFSVILIALFYSFYKSIISNKSKYLQLGLSSIGLLLTFYRSYLLASVFSVPVIMFLSRMGIIKTISKGAIVILFVLLSLITITLTSETGQNSLYKLADELILSGLDEIESGEGGSFAGREVYAEGRREILERSPILGFGFIDKDSSLGKELRKHIVGDQLGFIDKGDIDVALKFGVVGRILLYGVAVYLIYILVSLVRKNLSKSLNIKALTCATSILVFLLVQPVHAALTYSFSLLPLGIMLGLIERERLNLINSENNHDNSFTHY